MNRIQKMAILLMTLLVTSCSLDDVIGDLTQTDDADKFVGTYNVSTIDYVTWGGSSGTLTNSGRLYISKISGNRVRTSGFFSTQGSVSGTTLYLDGFNTSDAAGYISYNFGPAYLNGNIMTMTMYGSGRLSDNGYSYPYNITSDMRAIKM